MTDFAILAVDIKQYVKYIPLGVACLCGAVLLIAFIVGFVKGARKVRWGGFAWLFASVAYFILNEALRDKNPLNNLLSGLDDKAVQFISSLSIACVCILGTLILYGLLALIFREREEKVYEEKIVYEKMRQTPVRYDDDDLYAEYQAFQEFKATRAKQATAKKSKKKPSFFGRVFGALICTVNTALVLCIIVSVLLFVVDCTPLKDGILADAYNAPYVKNVLEFATKYAMDTAIIGIIFLLTFKGSRVGLIQTIRVLFVKIAGPVSLVLGLYLPFSPVTAKIPFLQAVVDRCGGLFSSFGASAGVVTYGGKILAGILLVVVLVLAFLLLNFILKQINKGIKAVLPLKGIDNALSALLFMVLGIALVAVIWGIVYVLSYYGIFGAGGILTQGDGLSKGIFDVFDIYAKGYLDTATNAVKDFFSGLPF